jgi:putative transposase
MHICKHRLPARVKQTLAQQNLVNQSWCMNFMSDGMVCKNKLRKYFKMNDCSCEIIVIEVDTSLYSRREIRTLYRIIVRIKTRRY